VAQADARVAPLVNRLIGTAAVALTRTQNRAGESSLGNLIADAQRLVPGARLAFMNPGGIRADLDAGPATFGELFTIQPFGNDLVLMELSGAQIETLLEQQWVNQPSPRMLVQGTNRVVDRVDVDALVQHVLGLPQPFSARIEGRITRLD